MRWPAVLFTLSFSLGLPAVLASACGTPGLGVSTGTPGNGGATSSGTGTGTPTTTGSGGGGSSATSLFDGGFGGGLGQDGGTLGVCVPQTCAEIGATCGQQGDGCGNAIDCGGCQLPQTCGGGGTHNQCGGTNTCIQRTCADVVANCGPVSDGCGGLLQCGICASPETCGGGGMPSVCGGDTGCITTTCAEQGISCGPTGDGCGGLLQCGSCVAPDTCGGGGTPGACGQTVVDAGGGSTCMPRTCAQQGIDCGPAGDGCGGLLQCGSCASPETCGGGGMPGKCGGNTGCAPKTCADLGVDCGPAGDGCGGELQCGSCTAPATCGGGGMPGKCGGFNSCVPKTCVELGYDCGPAGDGCGGLLQCGNSCPAGEICGGGGMPDVCGPADAGSGITCTGLCLQQVTCPGKNVTTTISGTVFAPNGADPIYDALVYVPNAPVAPFTPGVACDQCGNGVSGSPLVSATTAPDGTFQLQNVPVGSNIPVVVQLGRWRRQFVIPTVTACKDNAPAAPFFSLPKNKSQGDIPLVAMVTGSADGLECVLRNIGIDDAEFTDPTANGRIQWYVSNGANSKTNDAPNVSQLFSSQATLNAYDMVILACNGTPSAPPNDVGMSTEDMLKAYTTAGGRVFATHFSYAWLDTYAPFSGTATWDVAQSDPGNQTGIVDFTNPKGQAFAQWSMVVGASTTYGQVGPISAVRHDFDAVNAMEAQQWLYWNNGGSHVPLHYTFNTAVGVPASQQCGRILFSDFHVASGSGGSFPTECTTSGLTAQEHLLEFMLFDLASCITPLVPPPPPTCTPESCAQQGFDCGPAGDGCGGLLQCGSCTAPQTCGGGGMLGVCGGTACAPVSCAAQGIQCGPAGDGCGGLLQCGNCPNGTTCGGGGQPGKCGTATCSPITCAAQGIQCGPAGNGCGGLLLCGSCPPDEICGGGGMPGKCTASDAGACAPRTCGAQGIECGPAGDGCGGQLDCGNCPPPQTCGGGGQPGKCGAPQCTQTTCAAQGIHCGPAGDGCGGVLQCGPCPPNQTCGGGGMPGICGSGCMPSTCSDLDVQCGPAGDGCGGLLQCGPCTLPDTCGGGGTPGKCGHFGTN